MPTGSFFFGSSVPRKSDKQQMREFLSRKLSKKRKLS